MIGRGGSGFSRFTAWFISRHLESRSLRKLMEVFANAFKAPQEQKLETVSSASFLPVLVKSPLRMEPIPRPPGSAPAIRGSGPHTPRTSKRLRTMWQSGISKAIDRLRTAKTAGSARTASSDTELEVHIFVYLFGLRTPLYILHFLSAMRAGFCK